MSASPFEVAVQQIAHALPGVNATKYLSVAGLVVLLYDHLLLLEAEIRLIWIAEKSWSKTMFLINKYIAPACLLLNAHVLSGISTAGLSTPFCQTWLSISAFIGITSLAIANVFVVQRVWALWGRNSTVLKVLVGSFITVYVATYTASAVVFVRLIPNLSYSPLLRTCIVSEKPNTLILMYAIPLALDVFVFALTCWNAFDRPRHLQTAITKQLITDGVVYFVCLMTLRLFNILVIAVGDRSYTQLAVYFLWAMITAIINRMLIMSGSVEVHAGPDPSGRQTPFKMPDRLSYGEDDEDETEFYQFESFVDIDSKSYRAQEV